MLIYSSVVLWKVVKKVQRSSMWGRGSQGRLDGLPDSRVQNCSHAPRRCRREGVKVSSNFSSHSITKKREK